MSTYIPVSIRNLVAQRANRRCEYCLLLEKHSFLSFHVEHIISLTHGGETIIENLAFSCPICNASKGTDIGTILHGVEGLVRFFNPRTDKWSEHFNIDPTGEILTLTPVGAATAKILDMNHPDAIIERRAMIQRGFLRGEKK